MLIVDVATVLVDLSSAFDQCERSSNWPLDGGVCKATAAAKLFIKMINDDGSFINCLNVSVKCTFCIFLSRNVTDN